MKINFLGDSITFGGGATSHEKKFSSLVCQYFNAIEENYGESCTRIAPQKKNYKN